MRICMPTMDATGLAAKLHGHFGSAVYFTIVDTETDEVRITANGNQHHAHGQCQPLRALAAMKAGTLGELTPASACGGHGLGHVCP